MTNPLERGATNRLARRRNIQAAERTLLAWIQNSLTLIGVGIAIDSVFPKLDWQLNLTLIGLGVVLLLVAIKQYQLEVNFLAKVEEGNMVDYGLIKLSIGSVILFGSVAGIIILVTSG